ncbi:MAG: hypothetical protein ACUVUG_07535 [Candidatus Aminicenantia bacterium]
MMFGIRWGGEERLQIEIRGYNLEVADSLAQQIKKGLLKGFRE